jgi:hypothetical protein
VRVRSARLPHEILSGVDGTEAVLGRSSSRHRPDRTLHPRRRLVRERAASRLREDDDQRNSAIWATLYGHRKFVPVFGSEASNADGNIDSIKLELSENDLLYEDFPEAIHAIRALEGKAQRCHSQSYKGALTHIEWKADTIVLPTICGSKASGGIITAHGITAASRGMKHKRPDGTQQRPDFVIIDDPQTDESASSELQVTKRLDVIRKSILKLGGHNRRIAAVINATVIQPDDMIDQLLSTKKFPSWQGERIKMVRRWSKAHETLWLGEYQRIRNTFDAQKLGDQQRAHRDATQFYREHRREMDDGCDVSWLHCFVEDVELSAIQHAYNSLIDDGPEVFASECQNEPIVPDVENATDLISADAICEKLNHLPRGKVPQQATRLVAYIDVQKKALPWLVCAFDDQFGGSIVDYGTWPDQERSYFSINEIPRRRSIAAVTKADSLEAQIYAALEMSTSELLQSRVATRGRRAAQDREGRDRRQLGRVDGRRVSILSAVSVLGAARARSRQVCRRDVEILQRLPAQARRSRRRELAHADGAEQAQRAISDLRCELLEELRSLATLHADGRQGLSVALRSRVADASTHRGSLHERAGNQRRGEGPQGRRVQDQADATRQSLARLHRRMSRARLDAGRFADRASRSREARARDDVRGSRQESENLGCSQQTATRPEMTCQTTTTIKHSPRSRRASRAESSGRRAIRGRSRSIRCPIASPQTSISRIEQQLDAVWACD